ncbi:TPA: invasion antigen CiaC [Campylobacter jejuni]|nr:invasion antigen CiaC [Campylobacter jejuni]HEG3844729.1 invasion antigen CiaC [Campylobacter jejuni]HEG5194071.1 invasion antigen CiaC [Campylobacter jejuni]HEG5360801.1 invasion antigen CiaC [Campylobacter jejuni]
MVVDNTQKTSNAIFSTTTKVKEKNTSADEFQATLNEVKNKEEKTSSSKFTNEDIDLGAVREDFRSYAWQKMREDQYKKNEETLLNKLFATIDAGNATNNTKA